MLLRGYTHVSAPVSTRNDILVFLSLTKMRRVPKPSSLAASTDGWSRFPNSTCMGNDSPSRDLRTSHGSNKGRLSATGLGTANGGGNAYVAAMVGRNPNGPRDARILYGIFSEQNTRYQR